MEFKPTPIIIFLKNKLFFIKSIFPKAKDTFPKVKGKCPKGLSKFYIKKNSFKTFNNW